ncbi:Sodium/hydrogen exchanger 3 [Araneus ventricosus]|uniref:Sodium/hydrogen exchanger n=1 Tax=Araneus ventricosus TaxID=182803 RepID=A0A4Y2G088_ARAVE|nr:Sodium/hydrogen exchanger 3 [Araneus ventricosus]
MLLLVGVALGLVLFHSGMIVGPLTPTVFFLFMLPPIVFDAGYFMPNRLFFDNIISILVFAVIGTVWNALSIGVSLWAVGLTGIFGYEVSLIEMLLFSSIVSAVDPVAVLAVFEEIHVNEVLYIIVFGESLLNDAVTVVLYHMFEGYTEMGIPNILPIDYFSGVASFFVVSLGGTMIGILFGLITAFLSKHTTSVPVIEPMFPFIMGYMSYLFAEMFHLSGILSLIFCGITMKNYVEENISSQSHVTVKYVTKMLATASETIIFVVLGVSTVNDSHEWNTWFVIFSILFCSIYRAIGVIVLSAGLNNFRLHQLNGVEQFIMSYGGLRGAVAFALVLIVDKKIIPSKDMMVTSTIAVVYFTVFVQGMTIKFFVRILKVPQKSEKALTMNERLHSTVIDHVMGGIEEVADQFLGNYKIRDRFKYFNNKYLRRFLTKHSEVNEPKIFETHSKLNLMDAMNLVNSGSKLTLEPGVSFSTLLKNYTAANLNTLAPDEVNGGANHSPLMNLDMGEITYNPSFKDLNDSQIHHILEDAMFKPVKRPRRYSHSQFDENEPKHPPFHHHMRLQIRRLVSESKKRRRKNRNLTINNGPLNENKIQPISTIYLHSSPNHPQVTLTTAGDSDNDEGGITFSASSTTPVDLPPEEEPQRTLTETVLPWKRDEDVNDNDPAKPQEEFPTWVNNRDYYPGYLSPTPTFLESIRDHQPCTSVITESIEEEDECFEPEKPKPKPVDPSKAFDEHSFGQVEEDIIKEVMKEAQQDRSPSITHEHRRRMFRNSGRRSPDRFSLTSVRSEDFSRPTSDLSIECPDVVLDLENEEDNKNTKL